MILLVKTYLWLIPGGACTDASQEMKILDFSLSNRKFFPLMPWFRRSEAVIEAGYESKTHVPGSPGFIVSSKQKDIDAESTRKRDL